MSRARCVPLQYPLSATHGVKGRPITEITNTSVHEEIAVLQHLQPREDLQASRRPVKNSCTAMYTPAASMELERCQDLSELAWFDGGVCWPAAETKMNENVAIDTFGLAPSFEDYNIHDIPKEPYFNLIRTDSIEEIKSLAVAAPMEVVPMQYREAIEVRNIVKMEREEFDVGREEEVPTKELGLDELKGEQDEFDSLALDSQELLQELANCDLVNFITGDSLPQQPSPPEVPKTPVLPSPVTTPSPPPERRPKALRETYLAIPRELTSGDKKKIPKMVILKTPQEPPLTTINFQDISMSIAERIKTVGKRQRTRRTRRYSEAIGESSDDDDNVKKSDDDDEDYDYYNEDPKPSKRARRTSTTSTMSSSTDRYRELRDKNNEASRRSRQNRKEKEKDLMKSLSSAERKNTQLRARSDELEKLVLSLRKILLQVVLNRQTQ